MAEPSPFDALAERYDAWYDGKGRVAFASELAALKLVLAECPPPWLEIGVGSGRFAQALGIPLGIDPSAALLELAQRRGIRTICGRGEALPLADASLGTAFLLTTWEFLPNPALVLAECRRVLRPDGRLVNAYLDRDGKWAKLYLAKAKAGHPLFCHAHFDSLEQVRQQTEEAGFRVTRIVSTLLVGPDDPPVLETPQEGFIPGASFVVVVAQPS